MTATVANTQSPVAFIEVEPTQSLAYAGGVNRYTAISTIGTTTVKSGPGLYYGFTAVSTGTAAMVVSAYDITASGTQYAGCYYSWRSGFRWRSWRCWVRRFVHWFSGYCDLGYGRHIQRSVGLGQR